MKILIADDQAEVRMALKILLEQEEGLEVTGETWEIGNLLIKVKECGPEVVLLDWELSDMKVSGLVSVIRHLYPGLHIIAMSGRPEARKSALAAGVDAFVSKGDNSEKLLETLHNINDG